MAQTDTPKLDQEDRFPEMAISLLDGSTLNLPGGLDAAFTVLLIYRGKW